MSPLGGSVAAAGSDGGGGGVGGGACAPPSPCLRAAPSPEALLARLGGASRAGVDGADGSPPPALCLGASAASSGAAVAGVGRRAPLPPPPSGMSALDLGPSPLSSGRGWTCADASDVDTTDAERWGAAAPADAPPGPTDGGAAAPDVASLTYEAHLWRRLAASRARGVVLGAALAAAMADNAALRGERRRLGGGAPRKRRRGRGAGAPAAVRAAKRGRRAL
ncbi:hypothetical protein BU14_0585s0001 [Porphyra umbilicalis]|uniref:Uncharacterized protein n=1 Tax=Porphyra umbilicalis TaxID=2786 RepID=A0A1X6NRC5_PORUM|nr:hypothetical protein BU14_0585s0001 [Porphyra umbilicalis]|eukprot:OSX71154.1 hypothetical protein BU14_0585s0001 [Porphyra umbilicalis]